MLLLMMSLLDEGQRDLIEKIFREEKAFFFRVARGILASKEEAEDAVSEAMLKIIDNLEKISKLPRNKMRAYCIVIVKNCARERIRKDRKLEFTDQPTPHDGDADESAEERYLKLHRSEEIQKLLSGLSKEEQRLLFLRYEERKNYREIGIALKCSEESAKMRGYRIIEKLRKQKGDFFL